MNKPIGSHVDELLLNGFEDAFKSIHEDLKKYRDLEMKQKETKERLQRNLDIYNEIIELKGAKGQNIMEFHAPNRPIAYSITDHKKFEECILAIINS